MTFKACHTTFHSMLDATFGQNEVDAMFFILSKHFLNKKRIDLTLNSNYQLSNLELITMEDALARLQTNEPVQYITNNAFFYGFNFEVNKHVLIPRPETEELVSLIVESVQNKKIDSDKITILDIGTGSGCIAISLAKSLNNTKVYALDLSLPALQIAKKNGMVNHANITFLEADILKEEDWDTHFINIKFEIIVSNPPYVRQLEKAEMKPNVLDFEPASALFVSNESPLIFYDAIAKFASKYLKSEGWLFFEINQYLGEETKKLLEIYNFEQIKLIKDFSGNHRMIKALKPAVL